MAHACKYGWSGCEDVLLFQWTRLAHERRCPSRDNGGGEQAKRLGNQMLRHQTMIVDRPCKMWVIWLLFGYYFGPPIVPVLHAPWDKEPEAGQGAVGQGGVRCEPRLGNWKSSDHTCKTWVIWSLCTSIVPQNWPCITRRCGGRGPRTKRHSKLGNGPERSLNPLGISVWLCLISKSLVSPNSSHRLILWPFTLLISFVFYTSEIKSYCVVWPAVPVPRLLSLPDSLVLCITCPIYLLFYPCF